MSNLTLTSVSQRQKAEESYKLQACKEAATGLAIYTCVSQSYLWKRVFTHNDLRQYPHPHICQQVQVEAGMGQVLLGLVA